MCTRLCDQVFGPKQSASPAPVPLPPIPAGISGAGNGDFALHARATTLLGAPDLSDTREDPDASSKGPKPFEDPGEASPAPATSSPDPAFGCSTRPPNTATFAETRAHFARRDAETEAIAALEVRAPDAGIRKETIAAPCAPPTSPRSPDERANAQSACFVVPAVIELLWSITATQAVKPPQQATVTPIAPGEKTPKAARKAAAKARKAAAKVENPPCCPVTFPVRDPQGKNWNFRLDSPEDADCLLTHYCRPPMDPIARRDLAWKILKSSELDCRDLVATWPWCQQ